MKILVVGGAGYIGSVCSELLLNEGHEVAIFDNLTEGHRAAIDPRVTFIEGDLSDRPAIAAALAKVHPDAVMHFAANALVGESMENPSKYFRNNVGNGLNLLDAMVEAGIETPDEEWTLTPDELRRAAETESRISTIVDITPVLERKRAALLSHRSQIDDSWFTKIPEDIAAKVFGRESFIRASDTTGAPVPEDDLFAGLRAPEPG